MCDKSRRQHHVNVGNMTPICNTWYE